MKRVLLLLPALIFAARPRLLLTLPAGTPSLKAFPR